MFQLLSPTLQDIIVQFKIWPSTKFLALKLRQFLMYFCSLIQFSE